VIQLDGSYRVKAASPMMAEFRMLLAEKYDDVYLVDGELQMRKRP
jgi:hypothetical protein